jgi:N-acetylglutamate synthase-like GNAT family acetyltransferase
MPIRRAVPEEAAMLTDLAMRSKAHWGYDSAFLAAVRDQLTFRPSRFLPDFHVYVLESDAGQPVGFCSLIPIDASTIELEDLFVEPACIAQGYGKQLWDFAVATARSSGYSRMSLVSDPYAEPFYARRGVARIGEKSSPAQVGRVLPVMEYRIHG